MTKQLPCREHGGTFTVEARRGRPPVRCSDENPCTEVPTKRARKRTVGVTRPYVGETVQRSRGYGEGATAENPDVRRREQSERAVAIGRATGPRAATKAIRDEEAIQAAKRRATAVPTTSEAPRKPVAARSDTTPSVSKAHAAKALLEPLGWHCTARVVNSASGPDMVELTASRDDELLVIVWQAGNLISQNYSLWSTMKPSDNGMPKHALPFDPDELSDSELIRAISGMEVTWWNRIAKSRESATVSPDKVNITHAYNATGDEVPGDRVITFVDYAGSGFRSFRAGALLKIGK